LAICEGGEDDPNVVSGTQHSFTSPLITYISFSKSTNNSQLSSILSKLITFSSNFYEKIKELVFKSIILSSPPLQRVYT